MTLTLSGGAKTRRTGRYLSRGVITLLVAGAACSAAHGAAFTSLAVFGDSLSDTGNILAVSSTPFAQSFGYTPRPTVPFYTAGQFTNGADNTGAANSVLNLQATAFTAGVWHRTLADGLGIARAVSSGNGPTPAGDNYAYGGATTADDNFISLSVQAQVDKYLDKPVIDNGTLHAFWAGANDLIAAATAPGATQASVVAAATVAVGNMQSSIDQVLARLDGSQTMSVLWLDLPSLDQTPTGAALPMSMRTALAAASAQFKAEQAAAATALRAAHPTLNLFTLDILGLFNTIVANPGAAGFVNVTDPVAAISDFVVPGPLTAVQLAPAGANPDQWLFWDSLHPTSRAHSLIGAAALAAVPAPGTAAGLCVLGVLAARRRR